MNIKEDTKAPTPRQDKVSLEFAASLRKAILAVNNCITTINNISSNFALVGNDDRVALLEINKKH